MGYRQLLVLQEAIMKSIRLSRRLRTQTPCRSKEPRLRDQRWIWELIRVVVVFLGTLIGQHFRHG